MARVAINTIAVRAISGDGANVMSKGSIDYVLFAMLAMRPPPIERSLASIRKKMSAAAALDGLSQKAKYFLSRHKDMLNAVDEYLRTPPAIAARLVYAHAAQLHRAVDEIKVSRRWDNAGAICLVPEKEIFNSAVLSDTPEPLWHFFLCRAEQGNFGRPIQNINRALACPFREATSELVELIELHRRGLQKRCRYCVRCGGSTAAAVKTAMDAATAAVKTAMDAATAAAATMA